MAGPARPDEWLFFESEASGKAAVIYTEATTDTWTGSDGVTHELPEIVLAYEQ